MSIRPIEQDPPELSAPEWIGASAMTKRCSYGAAVEVLGQTLREGFDPEEDGERARLSTPYGQLLQMPSASRYWCGTKVVSLRPGNEEAGLPVIQGVYVLFDGVTMTPTAVLDGATLTTLRTPAVTALAVRHLASPQAHRVALFGTGIQAQAHIAALEAVIDLEHVDIIGRSPHRVEALVSTVQSRGLSASAASAEDVAGADVVLCCTSSPEPLFDGILVQDHAVVAAIGSHDPISREVDTALVQRASCVVESMTSARREAGDLIIPAGEGAFEWADAYTLRDIVCGVTSPPPDRPRLFKGTGMPWQDLAVVAKIYEQKEGRADVY